MRNIALMFLLLVFSQAAFAIGTEPKEIISPKSLKTEEGVVLVSVRSEIYLPETLEIYFIREGGSLDNKVDIMTFKRKHNYLAVTNTSGSFATRTIKMPQGRYKLVGHGMNCPSVPLPGMACAVSVSLNGMGGNLISRPSRGYREPTPSFEVVAGKMTILGDIILCQDNYLRWATLPASQLSKAKINLETGPTPTIPDDFVMKREVKPGGMFDNYGREY